MLLGLALLFSVLLMASLARTNFAGAAGSGGPVTGIAGKCLENQNGTVANGNPIQIATCITDTRQVWSWTGDKTIRVQSNCLDAAGTTAGSAVQLWSCTGGVDQQWRPLADGSLLNPASNLCLETIGGASTDGTDVQLSTCSASASAQDWNITQAVITLDPPALAAHASLPGGTPHTATPTITLDYAMAPEFKDWLENVIKPLMEDWYPVLVDFYTYPDHYTSVANSFTIIVDPTYSGIAATANSPNRTITIGADWARTHLSDGGVFVHESMHIIQYNAVRQSSGLPGWAVEGQADHAREKIYQDRPIRQPIGDEFYLGGYSPASLLLEEAENANGTNFLQELSARAWDGTYSDAMFSELTGSSINKTWFNATDQPMTEVGDLKNAISSQCVDLPGSASAIGTRMQLWTCNNTTAQDWYFKGTAANAKTGVVMGVIANRCLAVTSNATADGSPVSYQDCAPSSNAGQKWEYVGGTLRNPNSGKCLHPVGGATTNGTQLEIQSCSGAVIQQWTLPTMHKNAVANVTSKVLYPATFSDGQQGIGTTDALGNGYTRILTAPANNIYSKPSLSVNGSKVAFYQNQNGQQTATLRVANADGTTNTQLTTSGYFISTSAPKPLWSSDNSKVLVAVTPTGQTAVDEQWKWLWVNVDGSGQQLLTSSTIGGSPFAVTSTKVFFVNDNIVEQQLCSVNSSDGGSETCFGQATDPKSAALSTDGTRVASVATGTVTSLQVTSVGSSTSSTISLSSLGSGLTNVEAVTWVPNTTKVGFRAVVSGRTAWYAIDAVNPGQISKLNIDGNPITWYASGAPTLVYGAYTGLTPFRVTDTRTGSGQLNAGKTLAPNGSIDIQVAGLGGVPAEGVSAVVLNVTEAATNSNGFMTVWPTGTARPNASTLNNTPNKILNNQTTVGLGADGKVSIYNQLGTTDVVVDVVGYYSESGGSFTPTAPKRVIDSRSGSPVAAGGTYNVQVTGVQGIPAGATGIVADVTEVGATNTGYLTLYPAGGGAPTASSLNYYPNETLTKEVNVRLSAGGALTVFNGSPGTTHFIIDVVGYYTNDMSGMSYTPINPSRIADTRAGSGQPYAGQPIAGGTSKLFAIGSSVMPANAAAVINNLTLATATANTYLTAFPANVGTVPAATSVTYVNPVAFNQSTVQLSSGPSGGFKVYNHVGTTDVVIDSLGYYY